MSTTPAFEKLGVFYLGRRYDPEAGRASDDLVLYDSRDLLTHALCVGMTGSGKTGLCLGLIEEAAIDGVPVIAVDPKGDLGNLLLTFPGLHPEDFRPWVDETEAARAGLSPEQFAAQTAEAWRRGLAEWGQDGARIARLREAADLAIYTPGSSAGLPLSVVRSFAPPAAADADSRREKLEGTVSALLSLLGIEADPARSREHILLSRILDGAWQAGASPTLAELVRQVQAPPFATVGALDLDTFFAPRERAELAVRLNNLVASPGFAAWTEGEPLDVARLLRAPDGRPRVAVLSIAHLDEPQRVFFLTLLLDEIVAWMRSQPGTGSLRAIFYMDEVFGFFPPVAEPSCKRPLLTILKQGRAFGLAAVLATQNPVDLDYKGLANCGTWFLGRLQTERDKARVLDGLEGASAGASLDRAEAERLLSALPKRVFLLHDVHARAPLLMQTRWTLSYLRGPLTRPQISELMAARKLATTPAPVAGPPVLAAAAAPAAAASPARPALPPEAAETFLELREVPVSPVVYRPVLLARARARYADRKLDLDHWRELTVWAGLAATGDDPWADARWADAAPALGAAPFAGAQFVPVPPAALRAASYAGWRRKLAAHLFRSAALTLLRAPALDLVSRPGEDRAQFLARAQHAARERQDAAKEELERKYAPRLQRLRERIARAEEKLARESTQYTQQKVQNAVSIGATIIGALFGRRALSSGTLGRATTAARGVGRTAREKQDVELASENVGQLRDELAQLEAEFQAEAATRAAAPDTIALDEVAVPPRKTDITVDSLVLAWAPWVVAFDGSEHPGWRDGRD
ncbi:MAG: ATP-binding protein [Acidobacteria bacterium]|nr:ATP-binding protein [Acidobacteriota bacterium]